jgi:hypothetical protein
LFRSEFANDNFEENVCMFNKKRLVTAAVLIVATIVIVVAVAIIAGILFLRSSGDTVAMSGVTEVGVPNGPATTRSIGPAGGSIASPDGRITVTVPPNAVPGPRDFSIQPITNLAHGGVGNAYRLEPSGNNFATPVKVSFKLDDQDLKGSPAVAYQDPAGIWQAFTTADVDQASKTLTVSTKHFTDLSVVTYRLSPEKATLRVGETQYIELVGCRGEGSLLNRLRKLVGRGDQQPCRSTDPNKPSWSADLGTIVPNGIGAMYTAPAKKPSPNIDRVYLTYLNESGQHSFIGVFDAEITIVDRGYRASGSQGPTTYSGAICSLDKEFTVIGHNGPAVFTYKFTPSGDGRTGTGTIAGGYSIATLSGGGPYTIEGFDSEKTRIVWDINSTWAISGREGGGHYRIDLVPLKPDEKCNQ